MSIYTETLLYVFSHVLYIAEPDLWKTPITAEEHAKDYVALRELVSELKPPGTMIVGPDVASHMTYFSESVKNIF